MNEAEAYERMIGAQPDLTEVISGIRPFRGLDVLDLGAGTGRLSAGIAREAKSLVCTDRSAAMLRTLDEKLRGQGLPGNWTTVVADHRSLPIPDRSADLVVSGWSICYLTNTGQAQWRDNLEAVMAELRRVLRPDGSIVIFETMGTGTETPNPPDFLTAYYEELVGRYRFRHRWLRADYRFDSVEEARAHMEFFFGEELGTKIAENGWSTVPECAGVWWKHLGEENEG